MINKLDVSKITMILFFILFCKITLTLSLKFLSITRTNRPVILRKVLTQALKTRVELRAKAGSSSTS
jgi:hypothetical protein